LLLNSVFGSFLVGFSFFMNTRKVVLITIASIAAIGLALAIWAFLIEPNRLVVNETKIALPNWPVGLNNLKIVAIGDIHGGSNFIDEAKIRLVVTRANEQQPDLIVLLGDYVTGGEGVPPRMTPEVIAANLKGLTAKYGVYAVLGNHDWWTDGPRMQRALESIGVVVIDKDAVPIDRDGQVLWLMGVPDFTTHWPADMTPALAKINGSGPVIALTHSPDTFPELMKDPRMDKVVLTLAAHTHGGQVNLPGMGRLVVPSLYGQLYAAGLVRNGQHAVFVTTGIGTSVLPLRFRVPPEIAVLNLTRE
jgi:predicted MPP superfamily phosphohydrolase